MVDSFLIQRRIPAESGGCTRPTCACICRDSREDIQYIVVARQVYSRYTSLVKAKLLAILCIDLWLDSQPELYMPQNYKASGWPFNLQTRTQGEETRETG